MSNFEQLEIWRDACDFAVEVYKAFQKVNDFGLKDQVTRSAVSIASNIAEGSERKSDADFIRFLRIAKGSCAECRTQCLIAKRIGYITDEQFQNLNKIAEILSRRIEKLIQSIKR